MDAVMPVATRPSISDEIFRAVRAIAGAPDEVLREDPPRLERLNVFFPSNNLIYSYALYVLIPSLYSERVMLRPSTRVTQEIREVHRVLGPLANAPVDLLDCSQREFIGMCSDADLVIFTGTARNGRSVRESLRGGPSVLSFGSSPTPIVIGAGADLAQATRHLVAARLFNNGQDCLCPDAVFVDAAIHHDLLGHLKVALDEWSATPEAAVSSLVYDDGAAEAIDYVEARREQVVYGGSVDRASRFVEPTVLTLDWDETYQAPELFAPIFNVLTYDKVEQVHDWLTSTPQEESGGYVSVFGEPGLGGQRCGTSVLIHDATPLDIEDGNRPFGGYGIDAGAAQHPSGVAGRPLLVSAEACLTR